MKTAILILALLASPAFATDLSPATICPSYCTGITTNDLAVTVDYLNLNSGGDTTIISINGVTYRGTSAWTSLTTNLLHEDVYLFSPDGTPLHFVGDMRDTRTCVKSGRGQHCTDRLYFLGGTVE